MRYFVLCSFSFLKHSRCSPEHLCLLQVHLLFAIRGIWLGDLFGDLFAHFFFGNQNQSFWDWKCLHSDFNEQWENGVSTFRFLFESFLLTAIWLLQNFQRLFFLNAFHSPFLDIIGLSFVVQNLSCYEL